MLMEREDQQCVDTLLFSNAGRKTVAVFLSAIGSVTLNTSKIVASRGGEPRDTPVEVNPDYR